MTPEIVNVPWRTKLPPVEHLCSTPRCAVNVWPRRIPGIDLEHYQSLTHRPKQFHRLYSHESTFCTTWRKQSFLVEARKKWTSWKCSCVHLGMERGTCVVCGETERWCLHGNIERDSDLERDIHLPLKTQKNQAVWAPARVYRPGSSLSSTSDRLWDLGPVI